MISHFEHNLPRLYVDETVPLWDMASFNFSFIMWLAIQYLFRGYIPCPNKEGAYRNVISFSVVNIIFEHKIDFTFWNARVLLKFQNVRFFCLNTIITKKRKGYDLGLFVAQFILDRFSNFNFWKIWTTLRHTWSKL